MSDQPNFDYTVNDPAQVECPYCHKTMDVEDEVMSCTEYNTDCTNCGRELHLKIEVEVIVQAWKPEALK